MNFITEHKRIIFWIAGVIVLFIVYSYFKGDSNAPAITQQTPGSAEQIPGSDIIALLVDLKTIKIKKDIFSDSAFRSLQDFTTAIPDEPRGRANPFAPLGAAVGAK